MIHLRTEARSRYTLCGLRVRPHQMTVWDDNEGYEPVDDVCPGCSSGTLLGEIQTLARVYAASQNAGFSVPSSLRIAIERCLATAAALDESVSKADAGCTGAV
jgi:hypothetical protein